MTRSTTPAPAQYPYSNHNDPMIRDAAGRLVESVQGMAIEQVVKHFRTLQWVDRQEIVQDVLGHLATRSIRRFDPTRASWPTFARACIVNRCRETMRARRRVKTAVDPLETARDQPAPNRSADRAVEKFVQEFHRDPEGHGLTKTQAKLMRAIWSAPEDVNLKDLGRAIGMNHPTNISRMIGRIKDVLLNQFAGLA